MYFFAIIANPLFSMLMHCFMHIIVFLLIVKIYNWRFFWFFYLPETFTEPANPIFTVQASKFNTFWKQSFIFQRFEALWITFFCCIQYHYFPIMPKSQSNFWLCDNHFLSNFWLFFILFITIRKQAATQAISIGLAFFRLYSQKPFSSYYMSKWFAYLPTGY